MNELTGELFSNNENYLYFTITNHGYVNFVKNFCKRLKQLNILPTFFIVCTDKESYNELSEYSEFKCVYFASLVPKTFESWNSPNYKDIVFRKLDITKWVLDFAAIHDVKRVLYIDTDIWLYRDFLTDLQSYVDMTDKHGIEIIMQDGEDYTETPKSPLVDFTVIPYKVTRYCTRLCTGFMVLKPTVSVRNLFDYKNNRALNWNIYVGNQPYLNDAIEAYEIPSTSLPRTWLLNGSIFNNFDIEDSFGTQQALDNYVGDDTWLMHYTYTYSTDKVERMRQADHWLLDESEYNTFNIIRGGKPALHVRCTDGFANQLRLMLAGTFLVQGNYISSYTQDWVLNNHNNTNFLDFFEPLPGVNISSDFGDLEDERIITSSSFDLMLSRYGSKGIGWPAAINTAFKFLHAKLVIQEEVDRFVIINQISQTLGIHARRTCKSALLSQSSKRSLPLEDKFIFPICRQYPKVFLATDNMETQGIYKQELGQKLIVADELTEGQEKHTQDIYTPESVQRFTSDKHTALDFLILKRCKVFLGSHESSFSLLIHQWRKNNQDFHVFGKV